jgi:hypothetical protein
MDMSQLLAERVCICAGNRSLPITDRDIFEELDHAWEASEIHEDSPPTEIKALDYFFECHIEEDVWQRYLVVRDSAAFTSRWIRCLMTRWSWKRMSGKRCGR